MPAATQASVDVDVVRRNFNFDWATDPDSVPEMDTYWWWARSIRVDPMEVIADDDEGNLYRVPFSTDGETEVTFGEPERVRETFVPVAASVGAQVNELSKRTGQRVVAAGLARPEDKPNPDTAASSAADPEQEEGTMPELDMDALRSRLGLPEDADEEQINEALAAEPEGSGENGEGEPEPEGAPEGEPEPDPEPIAASDQATVTVDRGVWEQTTQQAREGAEARAEQVRVEREAMLSKAVEDGKIAPTSREAWATKLSAEPETAKAELEALPAGLIPVDETGVAAISNDGTHSQIMAGAFGISRKED